MRSSSTSASSSPTQRLFFSAGAAVLVLASLWWTATLVGLVPATQGRPLGLHALVMSFGFFPMFFAGFIFSVGLKWLKVAPIPIGAARALTALHVGGWLVFAGSTVAASVLGQCIGSGAVAAGSLGQVLLLLHRVLQSRHHDRLHGWLFTSAAATGALLLILCVIHVAWQQWTDVGALARAAVWGYVGMTFLAAAHRMVVFVSGTPFAPLDAKAPRLVLWLLGSALVASAAGELGLLDSAVVAAARTAVGVVLSVFALRWPFIHRLRPRLLKMLYAGFCWLALSFLLSALAWTGGPGTAALHAFTVGFLGTVMLTMLSRVMAGQAGVTMVADDVLWSLFVLMQATAFTRLVGGVIGMPHAVELASVLWACSWTAWAGRYGRLLWATKAR